MVEKKTCFVVMGFGKKTDHRQGKTFDLDKTYRTIIKPAVEAAGLECIRADEIQHSGVIDLPMYEQLLNADVVDIDVTEQGKGIEADSMESSNSLKSPSPIPSLHWPRVSSTS